MRKLVLALLAGAGACALSPAQAQMFSKPVQPSRYYVGLAAASADTDLRVPGIAKNGDTDWETSWKVFAGIDYDPWVGVEIGYTDTRGDDINYRVNGTANSVNGRGTSRGYGTYLAAKARYAIPAYQQAEVYAKLGLEYSHRTLGGSPVFARTSEESTGVYGALGAQWNLTPQWGIVAEYERYGRKKHIGATANVLTVGARFNF